jgi:hypothetical protein
VTVGEWVSVGNRACIETLSHEQHECAGTCPYVLALVQGLCCAKQRDFVAIVRTEHWAFLRQNPHCCPEVGSWEPLLPLPTVEGQDAPAIA